MLENNHVIIPVHQPSLKEKLFFLTSGILVSVPLTLFIDGLSNLLCVVLPIFYATACSVVIFTPFIEEFAKVYPLFYRHGETERSIFILAFLVGLGFGVTELLLYVFNLGVPVSVRLPGLFFHPTSTSITAYGIAKKRTLRFYLIAVVLHLTNNFSALFAQFWYIGGIGALLGSVLLSWHLYQKTSIQIVR